MFERVSKLRLTVRSLKGVLFVPDVSGILKRVGDRVISDAPALADYLLDGASRSCPATPLKLPLFVLRIQIRWRT